MVIASIAGSHPVERRAGQLYCATGFDGDHAATRHRRK